MRPGTFIAPLALLLVAAPSAADKSPPTQRVAALVSQLGDDSFARREAADKALAAIGEPALSALYRAATSRNPEVRRRASRLARHLHHFAQRREQARLQGVWVAESEIDNGRARSLTGEERITLSFDASARRCTIMRQAPLASESLSCTWQIVDASATPPQLDLVLSPTRAYRAIYKAEGDQLTLCGYDRHDGATQRPTSFEAKEGDGRYLIRLKRVKAPPPAPEPPMAAVRAGATSSP